MPVRRKSGENMPVRTLPSYEDGRNEGMHAEFLVTEIAIQQCLPICYLSLRKH